VGAGRALEGEDISGYFAAEGARPARAWDLEGPINLSDQPCSSQRDLARQIPWRLKVFI